MQRVNGVTRQGRRGDVNLRFLTLSLWERTVSSAQGPSHCRSQPTCIRHRSKARPSARAPERTSSWGAFSSEKPHVHRTQAQSGKGGLQCWGDRHIPSSSSLCWVNKTGSGCLRATLGTLEQQL